MIYQGFWKQRKKKDILLEIAKYSIKAQQSSPIFHLKSMLTLLIQLRLFQSKSVFLSILCIVYN